MTTGRSRADTDRILREAEDALNLFEARIDELDDYFDQLREEVKKTLRRRDKWRWFPPGRAL